MQSKEIHLFNRPVGHPQPSDFSVVETTLPEPKDGEILVKNEYLSVDPYMRPRMIQQRSYVPSFELNQPLEGGAIGQVIQTNNADVAEGDLVESMYGWRERFVTHGARVRVIKNPGPQPSAYLGILGMPGLTAYVGTILIGDVSEGDTVFVSGAAGAVGSVAGQIAKTKGCQVIGSAGSAEKVDYLKDELGFDGAFNYKDGDLNKLLRHSLNGQEINFYFDNVGGDHLQAALHSMAHRGRIALCGAIAQYNLTEPVPGPNNLLIAVAKELLIQGFIVTSYQQHAPQFYANMYQWMESGAVKYRETIYEGIESMTDAFLGLFSGENIGKMIVKV